jgi:hypothetical protein
VARSLPADFSVTIPADIDPRTYLLTAGARTVTGQEVSATVEIDVERPDVPVSIAPLLEQLIFDAPGEEFPMKIVGSFPDGSRLDITESSRVGYSSSDPAVRWTPTAW